MSTYRIAISGCGTAGLYIGRAAVADGRGVVTGLYDPVAGARSNLLMEFPDAVAVEEYSSLFEKAEPDVVVIAGPDHLHAVQAIEAAEEKCNVLVEKPLATTLDDARSIIAAVEANGVKAMTDQTMRYVPPFRQMSRAAAAGEIGTVFYIQGDYVHDMSSYYSPDGEYYTPWRADPVYPQNILLGGGCHPIDLMLWTLEKPAVEVFCYSSKMCVPDFPSDDCYLVSIRFESGATGKIYVASGCSGHGMGDFLEIYGTEGTLSKGKLIRRDLDPVTLDIPAEETVIGGHGWGGSVEDFLDYLDGTIENPIPLLEGARTVALCEAALESIRSGKPVRVQSP